jgi:formylglycine-generating enzyme required for sulfatase activity
MKQYLIAFLLLLCTASLKANDLQIANITTNVSGSTTTVSFDISWKNSWRGGIANNYDAAWVFIKYKDDNGEWHHLNLTGANNSAGAPLTIEAPGDKKGVFVYRAADGIGDVGPVNVTVGVQQQAGNYDIKVFGIEMVFVPQGSFFLGGFFGSSLFKGTTAGVYEPYFINNATPPNMGNSSLNDLNDPRGNGTLNSSFPTGYSAFYCMKYEVSQAGYRDFLNTCLTFGNVASSRTDLTVANQSTSGTPISMGNYRNFLRATGNATTPVGTDANGNGTFDELSDGEWVACNYLFWSDLAAYLDWAALRPMTEMEWGKIHRGPNSPVNGFQYSTGNSTKPNPATISNSGSSSETIVIAPSGASGVNLMPLGAGGPLRNGFAATASSNRVSAGSSFYGIFEISGNVSEYVVTLSNNAGRSFTGALGDGELNVNANANTAFWPGNNSTDPTQPSKQVGAISGNIVAGINSLGGSFIIDGGSVNPLQFFSVPPSSMVRGDTYDCGGRGVRQQ